MDGKKITYFVNPKGDITTIPADTSMHLYEIRASESEIEQLRSLFTQVHEHNKKEGKDLFAGKYFLFEGQGEQARNVDNELIFEIYRQIYMLGTEKTKAEVDELGIIPKLNEIR